MLNFAFSDEQQQLVELVRRFTAEKITPIAAECDRESRFPIEVFKEAWELGIINPTCPQEYGGMGLGELDNTLICEELAYGCTGI